MKDFEFPPIVSEQSPFIGNDEYPFWSMFNIEFDLRYDDENIVVTGNFFENNTSTLPQIEQPNMPVAPCVAPEEKACDKAEIINHATTQEKEARPVRSCRRYGAVYNYDFYMYSYDSSSDSELESDKTDSDNEEAYLNSNETDSELEFEENAVIKLTCFSKGNKAQAQGGVKAIAIELAAKQKELNHFYSILKEPLFCNKNDINQEIKDLKSQLQKTQDLLDKKKAENYQNTKQALENHHIQTLSERIVCIKKLLLLLENMQSPFKTRAAMLLTTDKNTLETKKAFYEEQIANEKKHIVSQQAALSKVKKRNVFTAAISRACDKILRYSTLKINVEIMLRAFAYRDILQNVQSTSNNTPSVFFKEEASKLSLLLSFNRFKASHTSKEMASLITSDTIANMNPLKCKRS